MELNDMYIAILSTSILVSIPDRARYGSTVCTSLFAGATILRDRFANIINMTDRKLFMFSRGIARPESVEGTTSHVIASCAYLEACVR